MKQKILKFLAVLGFVSLLPATASATIIYDTWTTNQNGTGNYELTVTLNASVFDISLTIDPWNAEAFGLFIDLGNFTIFDTSLSNINPSGEVSLFANDTTSNSCGPGCNLNGLNPPVASPDDQWEWVFRLGNQGFDGIQTFSFSMAANGATEDNWGMVGIRAQQLCEAGDTLPDGNCDGSDKSYGSSTPTPVPEPGTLALLGAGLLGMAFIRRRSRVLR